MEIYKHRNEISYEKYPENADVNSLEAKYGLPKEVKFCKKCVISNQRPNSCVEFNHTIATKKETIAFDDDGICDGCKAVEKKDEIDWEKRERELIDLCNKYRKTDGSFDCIMSGSGGKDSFYTSHMLKYKYNMHPLTVTWAPHVYTPWGWDNFQAWIHAGFDNYLCTPNGRIHRLITRLAVENIFHPFQPFMMGQKFLAPKLAASFNIPLIFYGENEAEYGNPVADNNKAERDWKYFVNDNKSEVNLAGISVDSLYKDFGVEPADLNLYMPVDPELVKQKNIQVHYMGYYLKWHPQGAYYYTIENSDFKPSPERTSGTYSKYSSIDDKIDDFHYYTTFIKFGIGRATYDAAQEIRHGEITREEGIALARKYDGEFPERFEQEIYDYLSLNEKEFPIASKMFEQPIVDRDYFMNLVDKFRSPHIWKRVNGQWKLRKTIYEQS